MDPLMSSYAYSSQYFPLLDLHIQEYPMHTQPMHPPSPGVPIDPALAVYPPYYSNYHTSQQQISLPPNYSSPSSQGSEMEHNYQSPPDFNGKRPSSSLSNSTMNDSRKKFRKDDESDTRSPNAEKEEVKPKSTRGSRCVFVSP